MKLTDRQRFILETTARIPLRAYGGPGISRWQWFILREYHPRETRNPSVAEVNKLFEARLLSVEVDPNRMTTNTETGEQWPGKLAVLTSLAHEQL